MRLSFYGDVEVQVDDGDEVATMEQIEQAIKTALE